MDRDRFARREQRLVVTEPSLQILGIDVEHFDRTGRVGMLSQASGIGRRQVAQRDVDDRRGRRFVAIPVHPQPVRGIATETEADSAGSTVDRFPAILAAREHHPPRGRRPTDDLSSRFENPADQRGPRGPIDDVGQSRPRLVRVRGV